MTAYIVKYALTSGITKVEAEDTGDGVIKTGAWNCYLHGEGREWTRTPEEAIQVAERMRKKKLASLDKQKSKLERLEFKIQ